MINWAVHSLMTVQVETIRCELLQFPPFGFLFLYRHYELNMQRLKEGGRYFLGKDSR